MRNHAALLLGVLLFGVALFAQAKDQEPPSLVFGGKKLYVGMSKGEAVAALSGCCKLSPPADSDTEKQPAQEGMMLGHFILAKDKSSSQILGTITFSRGRVVRITRPLATEVDTSNEDLV